MAKAAPLEDQDWSPTLAAFGAWRARRPERWQFVAGRPRLMTPASMRHSVIKNNVGFALRQVPADQGCTALVDGPQDPDRRHLGDSGCGGDRRAPLDLPTPVIAAPVIVLKVMSPSTEDEDHGLKRLSYRTIESLRR